MTFVDTNVVMYAVGRSIHSNPKRRGSLCEP